MRPIPPISRNVLLLVFVLAMIIAMDCCSNTWARRHVNSFEMYKTWHVHVVNGMSNNKMLVVHCKSKDNDLGIHNLTIGHEFAWKFKPQIFGKTLFWCGAASVHVQAQFNVFWEHNEGFCYRCNWKNCIWIAKDDGIYLKNIPENYDEFRLKWETSKITNGSYAKLIRLNL